MTIQVINDTQPVAAQETPTVPGQPIGIPNLSNLDNLGTQFTPTPWFSAGYLDAEYTFYSIQTTYQTDLGLQAGPSTASRSVPSNTDENQIVRVRRPFTIKTVVWTAQRLYVKPLLPHWKTSANEKLLKRTISARNPLQSLNHKTWEVCGQYVYAFKKEPFITVNTNEYFILPSGKTTAENEKIHNSLHAYTQADFSLVPLDDSWIPVDAPLSGADQPPVGYNGRSFNLDVVIPNEPREGVGNA